MKDTKEQPAPSVAGMDEWRWVPVEPTPEMLAATTTSNHPAVRNEVMRLAREDYKAMLSAAPVPPVQGDVVHFGIQVEKLLCEKLGREWSATGISIVGLIEELASRSTPQPPAQVDEREASGWIPVSERLPEPDQVVVLMNEDVWMNTGLDGFDCNWHGAGYLVADSLRPYWTIFGEIRAKCLDAATHWMPLYPAPSADGGKVESDEVRRLREALEDGRRAMFAVLNQETKLKAVAKRVLDAEIKRIDAALSAQQGEGERG